MWVDLEGQDHRSKVKVTKSKRCVFRGLCIVFDTGNVVKTLSKVPRVKVKGHMVQGQRLRGSRSNVMVVGQR